MTMTIDVSPEEEVKLREEAARRGKTPDDLLRAALRNVLGPATAERPEWVAAAGMFAYPLCGEDAQAWVTRTRSEASSSEKL